MRAFSKMIWLASTAAAGLAVPGHAQQVPATPPAQAPEPEPADPIAQAAQAADAASTGDIVVTGARATQRTSIELKRNSSVIVDGLVSDEIGATPDNSVGDTLERIAGVSADRFKGNANELSVRGLGPTLSFSTFNGREVSTAGGDRSVAFQQFPSELVNGVLVYKSQQADFIEGGVGGVIELRSLKPLDYGKRRLQFEIRGDFQPKADDVYQEDGLGYRANISYTDKFKTGIGDIGISIGYQRQDTTAPEDYYNANSTFQPCNTSALNPGLVLGTGTAAQQQAQLIAAGSGVNCTVATAPRTAVPATGVAAVTVGETRGDVYFANSSRSFRTQQTSEVRDAVIGALQWRPHPDLDISIDGQYSNRASLEKRNVLQITEGLRGITPLIVGNGSNGYSPGALISYRGNSNLEDQLERRNRTEEYLGGGLSLNWTPGDWAVSADASYSRSHRTETQKQTRMRSTTRVGYTLTYLDDFVVPNVTFDNFDVTNPANFLATAANAVYARNRFVTDRKDEIVAGRFDVARNFDGFLTNLKFGARVSDHHRTNDNARNNDLNTLVAINGQTPAQLITAANQNCRAPFTTQSYMAGQGTNLTNWATFDNDCLFRTFTGSDDALPYPTDGRDPSDIDVTERIYSAYGMASFRSQGSLPFSGNIGLRYVRTDVSSIGFRQAYIITIDPGADTYTVAVDPTGALTQQTAKGRSQYLLPSTNVAFELNDRLKLRLAGYRAIARSGIESFGAGINLNPSTGTGTNNIIFNATTGNPDLKPLRAWNADASLEFYASKDTILALAGYYKWIDGAVVGRSEPRPTDITVTTTTTVPGAPRDTRTFTINPVGPANDLDTRHLYGVEATFSHALTWLPAPFDGFGINGSANRAFADFVFPDTSPLAPYLSPENLIGLSKFTASGSVYYEKWGLSLRANYRYRSDYFKPNGGTNRSVRPGSYLNLSAQYNVTKRVQLKAQALNVTGTKDVFYKGGYDSIAEVSNSGTQYFFGFRVRL
ncbi:MAG: TonB-dependent receptor [Pseudomonadota bacterium]